MINPWKLIPEQAPFVLPSDVEPIDAFNRKANDQHRVHLEIVPEPFLGNPRPPVVLLSLNPGFVDDDRNVHQNPLFNRAARANLFQSSSPRGEAARMRNRAGRPLNGGSW